MNDLTTFDLQPLWLTFQLAAITSILLFLIVIPMLYLIIRAPKWLRAILESIITLPLVLPPSVLGFYLLIVFNPTRGLGKFLHDGFGIQLIFSFYGLVFGSMIFSLPFMIQPMLSQLNTIPQNLIDSARMLGKTRLQTFRRIELPLIRPAMIIGFIMSFAHTIGEFGLVLMIGGNIPNKTQVASIAIFNEVESLNFNTAHLYAGILCVVAILIVFSINLIKIYMHQK